MRVKIILIIGFIITAACAAWVGYIYPHYYTLQLTDDIVWRRSVFDERESVIVDTLTGETIMKTENNVYIGYDHPCVVSMRLEDDPNINRNDFLFRYQKIICSAYDVQTHQFETDMKLLQKYKENMKDRYRSLVEDFPPLNEIVQADQAFRINSNYSNGLVNGLCLIISLSKEYDSYVKSEQDKFLGSIGYKETNKSE